MEVTFVLVNYNSGALCRAAVASIRALNLALAYDIVVVDNASGDDSRDVLRGVEGITLVENAENVGFGRACNQGIVNSAAEFDWLVNPDARFERDIVTPMVALMRARPTLGAIGPALYEVGRAGDRIAQDAARRDPSPATYWRHYSLLSPLARSEPPGRPDADGAVACDWLTGASILARRTALDAIAATCGGAFFDPRYFLYFEDADLCRRLRGAGYGVAHLPRHAMIHLARQSSSKARRKTLTWFFECFLAYAARWFTPDDIARLRRQIARDMRLRLMIAPLRRAGPDRRAAYRDILALVRDAR